MLRIKKNDTVVVLTGKDKGKKGIVIDVLPNENLVKVKDVALITKHFKARRQGEKSGIKREESFIDLSNVMLWSSSDNKPCRVNFKTVNGKKVRICNRTEEII